LNITQQYRWLYKPAVFAACAVPAVLFVLAVFGHGPMDLGADPVRRLEHACGITALNLLLITLAVSPVRQLTGINSLVRLRRMLGLFAFFYVVAHFVVYAWLDQELNLAAVGADILKRPYITIGMLALLLLIPLAVTSTNGMMRRLGRRWTRLHQLVYVITALALWHFWWQVKSDIREPLLYVGIFAVLMAFRVKAKFWPARAPGRT
jgi:methionine sulfoxide reductase heme-binding subunit